MTRATELRALADRCEAAQGADRRLDAEIAVAVHGGEIVWLTANGTMEVYPARRHISTAHVGGFCNSPVPACTDSIDAAASLVPAERVVRLLIDPDGRSIGYVNHPGHIGGGRDAATPALALTAAALRALAEEASE